MFISHKYKFIFIKTRKTAGSSIEKFFYDKLRNTDIIFAGMPPENLEPVNCYFKNPEHRGHQFIKKYYPYEWKNYFKFTVERNSWDKVVSTYHWQKNQKRNMKSEDFTSYIMYRKKKWNKKDWQLYTENSKVCVDSILCFENLAEDFRLVCNYLGIPYSEEINKIRLKGNIRPQDNYRHYYNNDTKKEVEKIFEKEINYFGFKF